MSNANDFHSYNVIYIVYDYSEQKHMFSCINKILLTFCTDVTVEEFFVHAVNIFIVNQRKDVFS